MAEEKANGRMRRRRRRPKFEMGDGEAEPDPVTSRDEIMAYQVGVAVVSVVMAINDDLLQREKAELTLDNVLAMLVVGAERMESDPDFSHSVRRKVRDFIERTVN